MVPFKITTKWITIEIFRRGIVFTIASLLLTSGVALCNEEIIIALISIINKQVFKEDCNSYNLLVGVILILISLFLFYLLIINWRKEIYSELYIQIRKAVDSFGTSWRGRKYLYSSDKLIPMHANAQKEYENAFDFIRNNQCVIDVETYSKGMEILEMVGQEIMQLDHYIKELTKKEVDLNYGFDPNKAIKETEEEVEKIIELHKDFVLHIKEKEKYRIKG